MDFTLRKYAELCAALVKHGYRSMPMSAYMQAENYPEKVVLLRHDVDRNPRHALKLAAIEQQHNLTATYFFRTVKSAYDPDSIRAVHAMGHEVGYHYETLAQARGSMETAIRLFGSELAKLRQNAPVSSASMHGSPLYPWDNRAIWQQITPADFDLVGEAYRDIDYTRVIYLNDTGRTWNPTRFNLRDKTSVPHTLTPESTDDLITLLGQFQHVCISAHPERWQDSPLLWGLQVSRDVISNLVKMVVNGLYRYNLSS